MTMQSGSMPGAPTERGGNGTIGAGNPSATSSATGTSPGVSGSPGLGGSLSGPTGAGTLPDAPGVDSTPRRWARPEESNRSEFGAFLDDLSELARGGVQGDLRNELERRVSQARGRMSAALDQGMEMSVRARDQMSRGIDYSRDAVTERPLSYLAMAMVGGLLIGMLLSRRD